MMMLLSRLPVPIVHLLLLLVLDAFCADQSSGGAQNRGDEEALKRLQMARQGLNVHMFSSPNFAPMFGIIAGLSVVLVVAITFIVVGLLSMEPAKDSMLPFWPITDDEDVESKEYDWEFCCGTIHSFVGTFFFMAIDLVGLPVLLAVYCALLYYLDGDFFYVHFFAPILVISLGIITSFFGVASIVRLYLCLFRHRCSPIHDRIVADSMSIYMYRLVFLTLFSVVYVSFICWQLFGGPRSPEDNCDWERLWGFVLCIWVWVRLTLLALCWSWIALQFFVGALCCRIALSFVKHRYRGYWNEMP